MGKANTSFSAASRRQLFSGDVKGRSLPYRPPWAISELHFDDTCTNCGDCISACPTHILSFGRGRLPVIDFRMGECTFCGRCETACEANALIRTENNDKPDQAWNLSISIDENCLSMRRITCRSCSDMCEADAIQFRLEVGGKSTPELNPEDCTGCGACIAPCPVNAIHIIREVQRSNP